MRVSMLEHKPPDSGGGMPEPGASIWHAVGVADKMPPLSMHLWSDPLAGQADLQP